MQKLKDELDEIKVERQNLARKANAAERYKQKLQASQGLENVNTDLRKELDEIRQQLNEADEGRNQVAGLELAVEEYKRILPKIEQDRHELQMMKKQLEFDNETLAQRWNAANEQHAQDQESIANLTDKLEELQRRLSLQPTAKNNHGLDLELENSTGEEDRL